MIGLAGGWSAAEGVVLTVIDAEYGVGFRTVILEGVTQPVAWSRRP